MVVSLKMGEMLHEEIEVTDKDLALDILEMLSEEKYHYAYVAYREVSEWTKVEN